MLNKVMLIGHLGADPEIRHTQDGRAIANFRIATSDTWRDKQSGERREKTEWHSVVCFNENISKIVEQYLRKGSKCFVEGCLRTRKWQDKDGNDRYSTEVVLENFRGGIELLDAKGEGGRPAPSEEQYGTTRTRETSGGSGQQQSGGSSLSKEIDDEIPF